MKKYKINDLEDATHPFEIQTWIDNVEHSWNSFFFESIIDVFKFIEEDSTDDDYSISFNNISFDLTKKMSMDDYLAARGFQFPISEFLDDKLRSNRSLHTQKGKKRFEREAQKNIESYHSQRTKAKEEYRLLVSKGYLLPKTRLEILIDTDILILKVFKPQEGC